MADTVTAEAARVPRVSDEDVRADISRHELSSDGRGSPNSKYFYDLRDERQASRDKDTTIADLERRLGEACAARNEAIRHMSDVSRKLGEAEGKLIAAKLPGVIDGWKARTDALQARLTEAEQRAATAERRGFEAGVVAGMADPSSCDLVCPICHEGDFDAEGLRNHIGGWCPGLALAPAVPQEGETTP